jgi:hypothetical protein
LLAKILELGNDPKLYENIVEYFPPNWIIVLPEVYE